MPLDATHRQPGEDHAFYREVLHELIGLGTELARHVHAAATAEPAEAGALSLPEAAAAFDRVARAVRRTVLLAQRLGTGPDAAAPRIAARKRIIREVEDTISRARRPEAETEALHAELAERLDSPDLEDEIDTRPVAEIIADILRDLDLAVPPGLPRPWKRRTPADLLHLVTRAQQQPGASPHHPAEPCHDPHGIAGLVVPIKPG